MTQLIITLIIVSAAIATAVYLVVKRFGRKPKKEDVCGGCSSDCSQCGVFKELGKMK